MRLPPLLAIGLLAVTPLPAAPAVAAGETCQGRPATLVGTPGQYALTGTAGDDVVVTRGAAGVVTLGGNDLVCITSVLTLLSSVRLDVGAGDDVVDAAGATGSTAVILGPGRDTYTGSPFDEYVVSGTEGSENEPSVDIEGDVITTGTGGDDLVKSGSGPEAPNADVVVLGADDGAGPGSEVSWLGPMAAGASLDGGGGGRLTFFVGAGQVVVDARAGTYTEDGRELLRWSGFDRYTTGGTAPTPSSFAFLGADRDEELNVRFADARTTLQQIDMGAGDDTLSLEHGYNVGARGSTYEGGPGQDHVNMWAGSHLDLDLASGRMETRHAGRTVRTSLRGFETQLLGAKDLELDGTSGADVIRLNACRATVHGRGGADDMAQTRRNYYFTARPDCNPWRLRLFGGGGNDTLRGSTGRDVLVGGRGRDTVSGNAGRDRCSGEKLRSCEIKVG